MPSSLSDLFQRLSVRIEQGKGIQLSPDDLDILVATGAYAKLLDAFGEEQRKTAEQRIIARGGQHADYLAARQAGEDETE